MEKLQIHGGDVYSYPEVLDFSANCNPYGTPEGVKRAVAEALDEICRYPDVQCRELRKKLSEAEKIDASQIICGNGAADLIFSLVLAKKPRRALLPAPTFAEYEQALKTVGCEITYYYLKEEQGFVPDSGLAEQITEETDLVFFCNPNNPTGVLMDREYLKKLADQCRKCRAFLVLDECFVDFVDEPESFTFKKELENYDQVFILKAFTKKYAMAGIRLGYGLCTDTELLEQMRTVMQPWNVSVLAQRAGVAALEEEIYVKETMRQIHLERKFLKRKLSEAGLKVYASNANYIFFRGPKALRQQCLEKGISIRDCSNYEGLSEGFYRTAVRTRPENERLLSVLYQMIR